MKLMLLVLSFVLAIPFCGLAQFNKVEVTTPAPKAGEIPGSVIGLVTDVTHETITVKTEAANPISFAINKSVRYSDKKGRKIKQDRIKSGARVRVYYEGGEDARTATKVVLEG
jgi:hypothetical protein